jgi:hypothetical protein
VARYGPPDDFNRQPTQFAEFGTGGYQPSGPPPPTEPETETFKFDSLETEPTPWYRKPVTLIGWSLVVLILLGLIIYGIIALIGEGQGTGPTPTTTTTIPTTTTEPPSATTETSTPPPPTTTEAPPTTATGGPPPQQQPTQAPPPRQPTQSPTHHHLPPLPSTITIPGRPPITLPPNLPH